MADRRFHNLSSGNDSIKHTDSVFNTKNHEIRSISQKILENRANEHRQAKETSNYLVARAKEHNGSTSSPEKIRDYQVANEYLLKLQNTLFSAKRYTPETPQATIKELEETGKEVLKAYPDLIQKVLDSNTLEEIKPIAETLNETGNRLYSDLEGANLETNTQLQDLRNTMEVESDTLDGVAITNFLTINPKDLTTIANNINSRKRYYESQEIQEHDNDHNSQDKSIYDNAYDNVIDTREALKNYKRVTNNTFAQLYYRELRSLHDTLTDDANISRYWSQIKDLLQG